MKVDVLYVNIGTPPQQEMISYLFWTELVFVKARELIYQGEDCSLA